MNHDELSEEINTVEHPWWMQDALRAVVELHKPNGFGCEANCIEVDTDGYAWKNTAYPCPTIQAIEKELA